MASPYPATRKAADFAAELRCEDLPEIVIEETISQVLSVFGAVMAGSRTRAGALIQAEAGRRSSGRSVLIPSGAEVDAADAAWGNAGLSMALDYDDYLLAGHSGHSAVLVPFAVGAEVGASGADLLTAVAAANELEGRLGLSVFFSHQNGQLWSFIHNLGAAAAAGRLLGLDGQRMARAFGIALSQPPFALYAGFMGGEAKALIASGPARDGITAARLAAEGMEASETIIEDPLGFCASWSPAPIPRAFTGLGRTWLTRTLSFKIYPGCAYIDAMVDALLALKRDADPDPAAIRGISVRATILTVKMDETSRPFLRGPDSPAFALNFSVPYNAAAALMDGELTPKQFTPEFVAREAVWDLASRVRLRHDPAMTAAMLRQTSPMNLGQVFRETGLGTLKFAAQRLKGGEPAQGGEMPNLGRLSAWLDLAAGRIPGPARAGRDEFDLAAADLDRFRMAFGARVTVTLEGGEKLEAEQEVPLGAAGRPAAEKRLAVEQKFLREAGPVAGEDRARQALELIRGLRALDAHGVGTLSRLLCVDASGA